MRRLGLAFSTLFTVATAFGCSDEPAAGGDSGGGQSGSSTGGSSTGGSSTGGSMAGGGSGGTATGGDAGSGTSCGATSTGGSISTGGSAGSAGGMGGPFTKTGVCGQRANATVGQSSYMGTEEFYMVSQEVVEDGRLDEFICLIRYDVMRVGEAPPGCVDLECEPCSWTNKVVITNPTVVTDVDGACAKNELGWTMDWMNARDGTEASYGYIYMYSGHESVAMTFDDRSMSWQVFGRAAWESTTGAFDFDNRIGACQY